MMKPEAYSPNVDQQAHDAAALEAGRHVAGLAADLIVTTMEGSDSVEETDAYIGAVNDVVAPAGLRLIREEENEPRIVKIVSSPNITQEAEVILRRVEAVNGLIADPEARNKKLRSLELELTAKRAARRRRV